MNTVAVREMLNDKDEDGEYKIPFLVVCDAFQSETVAFADLVLPDTTYLERHDVMSMLDRPISEFDGPVDSVRVPVVPPTGECKPFQEVLIELASRLKLPAFTTRRRRAQVQGLPRLHRQLRDRSRAIGFLMGWRGKDGDEHLRGEPNPKQWEMYAKNNCVFHYHAAARRMQYMRNWNREYLDFAQGQGLAPEERRRSSSRSTRDMLQNFRLAAQGKTHGPPAARASARAHRRPTSIRCRSGTRRSKTQATDLDALSAQRDHAAADGDVPLVGFAERVAAPDPQPQLPARQSADRAARPASPTAAGAGSRSQWGKVRCMVRYSEAVEPGTVWTWNAIGKADGAWQLAPGRRRGAARASC